MPFGITSVLEHFQRQMETILAGQEGALCHMDDVLIFGKTQKEHDTRLNEALQRIETAGLTLNMNKCEFNKDHITVLGYVIDSQGVSANHKTSAILRRINTHTELRRFLGMVNQLGKFSPQVANISQPLRELLSTKKTWLWGPPKNEALEKLKVELTQPTVLALYNPEASLKSPLMHRHMD